MSGSMVDFFVELFAGFGARAATFLLAVVPLTETRASVPVGILVFGMPVWEAMLFSFFGVLVVAIVLPFILGWVEAPLRQWFGFFDRFFEWLERRVEKRFTERYRALGFLGLVLFVSVPLPVTGVWTGALASWLFGFDRWRSVFAIALGGAISIFIVAVLTVGGVGVFDIVTH